MATFHGTRGTSEFSRLLILEIVPIIGRRQNTLNCHHRSGKDYRKRLRPLPQASADQTQADIKHHESHSPFLLRKLQRMVFVKRSNPPALIEHRT